MNIAICEDERFDTFQIKQMLIEVNKTLLINMHIDTFENGERLLEALRKGQTYDILLMDIFLGKDNGMQLAKQIKETNPSVFFAFLTASKEYAIDAFALDALHYLTKPVQVAQLQEMIERYYERMHLSIKKLNIQTKSRNYSFSISTIQKILSAKKGVDVYLVEHEKPIHIALPFKKVEEQLPQSDLMKVSRGVLLHMNHIVCIQGNHCILMDHTSVLISRRSINAVKQAYYAYIEKSRTAL